MQVTDQIVPTGQVLIEIRNAKTGKLKFSTLTKNMFVATGKAALADAMRGTETSSRGIITYCAVGTGTTAPAQSDTQLQTELFRKQISVRSVASNVATFQTFFTAAEAIGTLREAGLFGDAASGTANSGTLFCRVAINRAKSSADTLTLSWAVTIA